MQSFLCLLDPDISAFCSSSGVRGPSLPSWAFLLSQIFAASLSIHAVIRISFLQLENVNGSIASSSFTVATAAIIFIWRRSMSSSEGEEATWIGHSFSGRRKNSGLFIHSSSSLSATLSSLRICLDLSYSEFLQPLKTHKA